MTSQVVVAKIGTSSITDHHGDIQPGAVAKFCAEVAALHEAGHRVVVVTSGAIDPGPVFDLRLPLDEVAEGYRAMDERRAIKVYLDV